MMDFIKDLLIAVDIINDKKISSFCYDRNKFLENKFDMH
jgi:AMP deaminase